MELSKKNINKFGMFTAIMMVFGSLIGIGIFFKNYTVFKTTHGNPAMILIAWGISAIIAIATTISFSEIFSTSKGKMVFYNFIGKIFGVKSRNMILIFKSVIYYSIVSFVISVFVSEAFFTTFSTNKTITEHFGFVMLLAGGLFGFFSLANTMSRHFGPVIQNLATIMKLIPIVLIIISSFFSPIIVTDHSLFIKEHLNGMKLKTFDMMTIIILLPTILFAFDGFNNASYLGDKFENNNNRMPKITFFSMFSILIIYILILIAQLFASEAIPLRIVENSLKVQKAFYKFFWVLVSISALGVLNGTTMAQLSSNDILLEAQLLPGLKTLDRLKLKRKLKITAISLFTYGMIFVLLGIPSIILNTDILIDAIINYIMVLSFSCYLMYIIAQLFNRLKIKKFSFSRKKIIKEKNPILNFRPINNVVYIISTFIAILLIISFISIQIVEPFLHITSESTIKFGFMKSSNELKILMSWHLIIIQWLLYGLTTLFMLISRLYKKESWIE